MGWKGESRRHSLSRKGIKTNLPDGRRFDVSNYVARGQIEYDHSGNEMVSDGVLKDLYDKAKSSITKSKIGVKIKEKLDARKQSAKVEEGMKRSDKQELEQASHFGKKPPTSQVKVTNKGRVGAITSKIQAEQHSVPKAQMNNVTTEMLESMDADSLIAIAENTEKLMHYSNEMKYDLNMLKVEGNRLYKIFKADERKEYLNLRADQKLAKKQMEIKIDNLKMTGLEDKDIDHKVSQLKSEYKQTYEHRKIEIESYKNRNKVTILFIKDLSSDLRRNITKIDKKAKRMSASGVKGAE